MGVRERMQTNCLYVFTSCREQQEVMETREMMQAVWDFQTNMPIVSSRMVSNPHKGWKLKAHLFLEEPKSSCAAMVSKMAVMKAGHFVMERSQERLSRWTVMKDPPF